MVPCRGRTSWVFAIFWFTSTLVLRPDRQEISADGEDVAVCTLEVQDAEGRVLPITENEITFQVTGPGEIIGTGNGDPTNHEPDPGPKRKAFAGLYRQQTGEIAG